MVGNFEFSHQLYTIEWLTNGGL